MALFFFLNLVAVLFKNPFQTAIHGWDNSFYYFWLRSPFVGGDFDFRDDIKETDTLNWKGAKNFRKAATREKPHGARCPRSS